MVDIFGTLGPTCDNEEILTAMFREGMTGIRINLSHVMLTDCADSIKRIQNAASRCGITPKILIDMQGPELRIGDLKEPMDLREGDKVLIPLEPMILRMISPGQEVLLDDGRILAEVVACEDKAVALKILRGGILKSRKSIAIAGANIDDIPALTDTDRENLKHAAEYGITGVMQPFVRSAEDLKELRQALDEATVTNTHNSGTNGIAENSNTGEISIYAKIENMSGVENLTSFFPYADEIIIARGDLGNAMPLWELPGVQKKIAKTCREHKMPFMVVTQMLSSMEHSKVPTRAEVSDIYNAVMDGAASVMVTGETAIGDNPVDVIRYLTKTARSAAEMKTSEGAL